MPTFKPINPEDKFNREILPFLIGIGPNGNLLCYGSCFIAHPHMAITAKHVVDELLKQDPNIAKGKPSIFEYWVTQVVWESDQHNYVVWAIDSISTAPHSDIAIIWLRAYDENASKYREWKTMPITFDPPPVGSKVTAFGLHNVRFDGSRINSEGKFEHIAVTSDRSISTGIVKQHHWTGRDKGMYNFPCFEVDARFEHGMSGGLVINERSEVCGIVCGSLPATSEIEDHISYVTMLWPMMVIPVQHSLIPDSTESRRYILKDLSMRGVFTPHGWERVLIEDNLDAGGGITIRYQMKNQST